LRLLAPSHTTVYTWPVQKLSGLVLFLQYERTPRDAASSERLMTRFGPLAVGTLALAGLRMTE